MKPGPAINRTTPGRGETRATLAHHACFLGITLMLAGIFRHGLSLVARWSISVDQYSHILLVVPISAALIYMNRRKIFAQAGFSLPAGLILLGILGLFAYAAHHAEALSLSGYISLSVLLFTACFLASFLLCYGGKAFRAGLFPLLFLVLIVPLPDAALSWVIRELQDGSASSACALFRLAHVAYVRHDVVLSLPRIDIYIAEECSGIRSSMVLLLCSLVLGHLYLKSAWTQVLLTFLVVPLMVAKNGLRIFVLSMLGMYVDPSFLSGRLHHDGGFIFFGIAFAAILAIIWLFRKLGLDAAARGGAAPAGRLQPEH